MVTNCINRADMDSVYCEDEIGMCEYGENRRERHESTAGKAILNCGCGSVGPLPILDLAGASIINPYSIASVTIDNRGLKNPMVLLNFTGLINVPVGVLPNITFRITKCMNGCSQNVGGSYTYSDAIDLLHSESFAFQYCDCGDCRGCATYTIEISNATLLQAGTMISGNISALAVEKNC